MEHVNCSLFGSGAGEIDRSVRGGFCSAKLNSPTLDSRLAGVNRYALYNRFVAWWRNLTDCYTIGAPGGASGQPI